MNLFDWGKPRYKYTMFWKRKIITLRRIGLPLKSVLNFFEVWNDTLFNLQPPSKKKNQKKPESAQKFNITYMYDNHKPIS